jgi:uncharacterized Zn finger protein
MNSTATPSRHSDGQGWSRQWRTWLRTLGLVDGERGGGRVKRLEVTPGLIVATVQDRSGASGDVEIRFAVWSDEQWQRVIDALGSQALFVAQLLAGDLPPELERIVTAAGVRLLPASQDELDHHCTCLQSSRRPCEHLVAVYLALGDMLAEDPWLLFRLRGRDQQSVLRSLRTHRALAGARSGERATGSAKPVGDTAPLAGGAGAAADGTFYRTASVTSTDAEIPLLEEQLDGFWGSSKSLETFRPHIVLSQLELVLLRRLGPPPMGAAGGETYDRLAALYRRISQEAMTLAYASEPEAPAPENGDAS